MVCWISDVANLAGPVARLSAQLCAATAFYHHFSKKFGTQTKRPQQISFHKNANLARRFWIFHDFPWKVRLPTHHGFTNLTFFTLQEVLCTARMSIRRRISPANPRSQCCWMATPTCSNILPAGDEVLSGRNDNSSVVHSTVVEPKD